VNILLSGPVAQAIGWALLHLLWQGVLVAAILAATLALMKRQSANARYLASCGAMVVLLVLLVATAFRAYEPAAPPAPAFPAAAVMHASEFLDTNLSAAALGEPAQPTPPPTATELLTRGVTKAAPYLPTIVMIWAAGVLLLSIRLLFGWVRAHELARRNAQPAGSEWQQAAARLADALRLRRGVELLESAAVEVPTVIGFFRPIILLPMATLSGLSTEQIEMILAHELAHIRRHDFLINLLQAVVETLLFYHPAVWWMSGRVRIERENCCDDMAVAVCGNALQYARALTRLEELRVDPAHAFIAANGGSLISRIRRLIGERAESPNGPSRWAAGAALLTVLLVLLAAPSLPLLADRSKDDDPKKPVAKQAKSEVTVHAETTDADDPNDPDVDVNFDSDDMYDQGGEPATPPVPPVPPEAPEPPQAPPAPHAVMAPPVPPTPPVPPVEWIYAGDTAPRVAVSVAPRVAARIAPRVAAIVAPRVAAAISAAGIGTAVEVSLDQHDINDIGTSVYVVGDDDEGHGDRSKLRRTIGSGDKLTIDELIALRSTGVTPQYIESMRAAGLGDLTYHDVISMAANGVTVDYVKEMRAAGFDIKDARSLVGLRANGVTPDYIKAMRAAGLDVKDCRIATSLRANGVDPKYIADMKAAGLANMTASDLIALRANGVSPAYIEALNAAGYKNLNKHDLVSLRANGVTPAFIKTMADAGYTNLSVRDLIRLAANGVNAEFIRDLQKYRTNK
jgi:beta-lactamase regulating signal transducer with metallopeptidase domain